MTLPLPDKPRVEPKWTRRNDEWVRVDMTIERDGSSGWKETEMKHIEPGSRFGALVVGKLVPGPNSGAYYECQCDCGSTTVAQGSAMRGGRKTSCGCRIGQNQKYHAGSSSDPEYYAWRGAISRCTNPRNPKWSLYGGRGISVCERWLASYDAFLTDMGHRPTADHSLDRINGNGNYEPSNCRWATAVEQNNNRSNNKYVDVGGELMSIAQASRALGIPDATLRRQVLCEIQRGPGGLSDRPAAIKAGERK